MHIDVALDIDEAVMERVDLGDKERERTQVRPFGGEELTGTRVQVIFVRRVDLVTPRASLRIEIGEVSEGAAGEKVVLDKVKRTLDAG